MIKIVSSEMFVAMSMLKHIELSREIKLSIMPIYLLHHTFGKVIFGKRTNVSVELFTVLT
jgi:hypothetical protein